MHTCANPITLFWFKGPGEQGQPVVPSYSEKGKDAYAENGFNIKTSNKIALDRSLPDIRNEQ